MFCTGCVKALYFCPKISVALTSYHSNDIVCDSLLICKDLIHSAQFSIFYGLSWIPLLIQYRNARYQKLDGETYSFDIFYTLMHKLRVVMDSYNHLPVGIVLTEVGFQIRSGLMFSFTPAHVVPALPFRLRAKLLLWILATNQEWATCRRNPSCCSCSVP